MRPAEGRPAAAQLKAAEARALVSQGPQGSPVERRLLLLLLILSPLTYYGLDQQWTLLYLEAGAALVFLVSGLRRGFLPAVPGLLPLIGFCALPALQLIPLPPELLRFLSPTAASHYQDSIWVVEPGAWMPLSILPKATSEQFLRFVSYALLFLATVQIFDTTERLKKACVIICSFAGVYAFFGLLQFFVPGQRIFWVLAPWPENLSHAFGSYVNGNHAAGLLEMLFPLTLTLFFLLAPQNIYGRWRDRLSDFFSDPGASRHILIGLSAVFIALSILFSLSRGGTISLVLSTFLLLGLLLATLQGRTKPLLILLLLMIALGLVGLFGWQPVVQRFDRIVDASGQLSDQRPVYWQDSLALIADYPLFGTGLGSFVDSYKRYQSIETGTRVVRHAHNDYVELLADGGVIGFALSAWFLAAVLRQSWPAWRRRKNRTAKYLYLGALCGLFALLCHSVTDFNLAIPPNGLYFFFLCGVLVAAANLRSSRVRKPTEIPPLGRVKGVSLVALAVAVLVGSLLSHGGTLLARHSYPPFNALAPERMPAEQRTERLDDIRSARRWDPLEGHYRYAEAKFLLALNKPAEARRAFSAAMRLRPYRGLYLQQAGQLAAAQGDNVVAGHLFAAGLAVQPSRFAGYKEYALWQLSLQKNAEAIETLRQGLQRQPQETGRVLTLLALTGLTTKVQVQQVLPQRAQCWVVYADYLLGLNDEVGAEDAYRRAVQLVTVEEPRSTAPYWSFYRFLRQRKRYAEALSLMIEAGQLFPDQAGFHSQAGVMYERQDIVYRAVEEYRQALLLNPRQEWVRKRLERIQ